MSRKAAPPDAAPPEVQISYTPIGRETLALISEELRAPIDAAPAAAPPLSICELLTFVVQGQDPASLAADAQRRRFVEQHLLARIPERDPSRVERIDVTPWTAPGALVVRVWCKL